MLNKKEYVSLNIIDGDVDVCEEVEGNYSGGTYLGDAITEVADSNINIYYNELWETAPDIKEYIEEGLEEGLVDTTSSVDLMKIFQVGEYKYYTALLYENLENIIFNYAVEYFNNNYVELFKNLTELEKQDRIEHAEEKIEEFINDNDLDNNNTFDDIEEAIKELVEELEEEIEV